ncbi:EAL domain-containing protein [Paludibacterium sp. THUN1379]|uniref:PTS sugar transporter subunit IIC/EAL domain-containing protein n=1 Tax=Paludibacterium sp. THUN1379 TaxID=3112107 RepID=UPI00308FF776|nr:EAL domain-containing protein [Paludibacterium sp. THUN1379]
MLGSLVDDARVDALLGFFERLGQQAFFIAIRRGLAFSLPPIMVGALIILLRHFPSLVLQRFFSQLLGEQWFATLDDVAQVAFSMVPLAILAGYASTRTEMFNEQHQSRTAIPPLITSVVMMACLLIVSVPGSTGSWSGVLSVERGLLAAIVIAALGSPLFLRLASIPRLQLSLGSAGFDPMVRDIVAMTPAAMCTILLFCGLRALLLAWGFGDLHAYQTHLLGLIFTGHQDPLHFVLSYVSIGQLLWFFGLHGPNILAPVTNTLLIPSSLANVQIAGHGAGSYYIVTREFIDAFARLGGSGSTLCLIAAIQLGCQDRGIRRFALFALIPAAFNINEPLLFGIPLILNPVYLIPFVCAPLLQICLAYAATQLGLIPCTTQLTVWTTPPLLNVYAMTHSLTAVWVQGLCLLLGTLIYLPFVRLSDTLRARRSRLLLRALASAAEMTDAGGTERKVLSLPGELGLLAEALAFDLQKALQHPGELFLEYQPQIMADRREVYGVEALLRWAHPVYGRIPPPLVIALAEDIGCLDELGMFVLSSACQQRAAWSGLVPAQLKMSVNISPRQLINREFATQVLQTLSGYRLDAPLLELEITETTALEPDDFSLSALQDVRHSGVRIALDDFGMGHTSLRYLRDLPIDTIKIDKSLTRCIGEETSSQIVRSIVELSHSLAMATIVEGVEDETQLAQCLALGCDCFQGYLFSPPLPAERCLDYIRALPGDNVPGLPAND